MDLGILIAIDQLGGKAVKTSKIVKEYNKHRENNYSNSTISERITAVKEKELIKVSKGKNRGFYDITNKGYEELKQIKKKNYLQCEKCIYTAKNYSELNQHLVKSNHGEIKVEKSCLNCGENSIFSKRQIKTSNQKHFFCSNECKYEYWEKNPVDDGSDLPIRYGENNSSWKGGKEEFECEYCGEKYKKWPCLSSKTRFCSSKCLENFLKEHLSGEESPLSGNNHYNWKGGNRNYYGANWKKKRRKALERDNYKCQKCGKSKNELGMKPSVHHIKPFRKFSDNSQANKLKNLVCLCKSCHGKWEGIPVKPDNRN